MKQAFGSLTQNQKQVLDYIRDFQNEHGFKPTQAELARHFKFKSLGTVQDYLSILQKRGYLEKSSHGDWRLTAREDDHHIPLLGKVAAGRPIEAILLPESVEVPQSLLSKSGEHFALRVVGDSMIEDGILDGDIVVIRRQAQAENNQTVVALIDNEATIKRLQKKDHKILLIPANPHYKPIEVDSSRSFKVEGILTGVLRQVMNR